MQIVEGSVYLGSFNTACNRQALQTLVRASAAPRQLTHQGHYARAQRHRQLRHAVHRRPRGPSLPKRARLDAAQLAYLHCPLDDHPSADISVFFAPALAFLQAAQREGRRTLIHCKMGMRCVVLVLDRRDRRSRSATLAILWHMELQGLSLRAVR